MGRPEPSTGRSLCQASDPRCGHLGSLKPEICILIRLQASVVIRLNVRFHDRRILEPFLGCKELRASAAGRDVSRALDASECVLCRCVGTSASADTAWPPSKGLPAPWLRATGISLGVQGLSSPLSSLC